MLIPNNNKPLMETQSSISSAPSTVHLVLAYGQSGLGLFCQGCCRAKRVTTDSKTMDGLLRAGALCENTPVSFCSFISS